MILKKIFRVREIDFWVQVVLVTVFLYALWWLVRIGITRYFDNDELTHLHWAAAMARGERLYVDFFTFFTPGFYWFLSPVFTVVGYGVEVFTVARGLAIVIFLGILGGLGWLYGIMRGWKYALVPVIFLAALPMPYDKFLEIRPDNLATLLGLFGLIFEVKAILGHSNKWWWLGAGVFYSLALIVLVKILPFVVVGVGVAVLSRLFGDPPMRRVSLGWFGIGLGLPLFLVGLWLWSLGDWSQVWYSLTRAGVEANQVGRRWVMEPHLFFFPNLTFYGGTGITGSFLFNHAVWVLGAILGTVSLLTPWLRSEGQRVRAWAEVLIGGIFFLTVAGYVVFFPLKHVQYLIPIAVFMAFYAADVIVWGLVRLSKLGGWVRLAAVIILGWVIVSVIQETNTAKLDWTSREQLQEFVALQKLIPPKTQVIDLDGRLWFGSDAYPICCLSFGDFTQFLTRPFPPLKEVIATKKPQYVFQGDTNRFNHLRPEDQAYIRENYQPVASWGERLWELSGR